MRRACLFLGPSLPADALPADPRLTVLPPAARGDVAALISERPHVVAIVDGGFEGVPAVTHKEILHAIAEGVIVVGGASMGALRAAELHGHGMRGAGRVFADYASGRLTDDDEVAVLHGPVETGYRPLSVAMVDVRATLDAAVRAGALDADAAARLTTLAKRRFYKERGYATLRSDARDAGVGAETFWPWCAVHRVEQKALDARAVVRAALLALDEPSPSPRPFVWTNAYATLFAAVEGDLTPDERAALSELRLRPERYAALRDRALLSALAGTTGGPTPGARGALKALRDRLGLARGRDEDAWLTENAADPAVLARIAASDAALDARRQDPPPGFARALADAMRVEGLFAPLLARALAKRRRLDAKGLQGADPGDLGVSPAAALWSLAADAPADDFDGWLERQGFADRDDASRQALLEQLYTALSVQNTDGEDPA